MVLNEIPVTKRDMTFHLQPGQSRGRKLQTVSNGLFLLTEKAAGNYPPQHNSKQIPILTPPLRNLYTVSLSQQRPSRPGKLALWQAAVSECQGLTRSPKRYSFERVVKTLLSQQGFVNHRHSQEPQSTFPQTWNFRYCCISTQFIFFFTICLLMEQLSSRSEGF